MDSADDLLGGLASGGGDSAPQAAPLQPLKRDSDSTDDFEHLQESPVHAPRAATQSFLDMERELFAPAAAERLDHLADKFAPAAAERLDHLADKFAPAAVERLDHMADKFTDSESDADTAESPLHRPAPAAPRDQPAPAPATPEPASLIEPLEPSKPAPPLIEPPKPAPPLVEPPKPAPVLVEPPKPAPAPVEPPKPAPAPVEPPKPAPVVVEPPKPAPVAAPQPPAARPAPPHQPEPARAPVAHVIEAEVIFCQMGLDAWFDPQRLHPEVESLIYWRAPARSGAALGAGLALLVALACCSVVSVLAYASLLALTAAVAFRIYKSVLQAVQKTNDGHPFKWLLETEISVPAERAQELAASTTAHLNVVTNELRRLFLVEDLVDSLKFGVLLWCLTYVGACFNGITLIILGWIALFTLPKAYEMNKAQVDANLELARAKIDEISAKVRAAVPLGRKAESEKDK